MRSIAASPPRELICPQAVMWPSSRAVRREPSPMQEAVLMNKLLNVLAELALLTSATAPLRGQGLADLCKAATKVRVGQWASYEATDLNGQVVRLRFGVVGRERQA